MAHAISITNRRNIIAAVLLLAVWSVVGCSSDATGGVQRVEIKGEVFELEVVLTKAARFRGLSGRESIATHGGMLFVFPSEDERTFVMRDCLVPIDILFLNPRGTVLNTHAMQIEPPGTLESQLTPYTSNGPSSLVIELAGGTVERLGVEAGDIIELPVLELKRRAR